MSDCGDKGRESCNFEVLVAEYERAQEVAHHADFLIYEVAAIIWGGNTLLLGFILEAQPTVGNEVLMMGLAILGIVMSIFVTSLHRLAKKGQKIAFRNCQEIEENPAFKYKLHSKIKLEYPEGRARSWIWTITAAFVIVWIFVLIHAGYLLWMKRCGL
jgi:hypothetical protein